MKEYLRLEKVDDLENTRLLQDINKEDITKPLIKWFEANKRRLPWRETDNPYHILISEIMLQQTQVSTVIPYYLRFIEQLPEIKDLAYASDEILHHLWEGLGYYSRVMRLRQFALKVVEEYGGHIPSKKSQLLELPGIGPYTAGAVLSFAFNQKEAAIDGNVKRVLSRIMADDSDISKVKTVKKYTEALEGILPDNIYSFNQGLIELGALVCTPKQPKCMECPLSPICKGYKLNIQLELPNKPKKVKQTKVEVPLFIIEDKDQVLFIKRHEKGLLQNMWGLPIIENDADQAIKINKNNGLEYYTKWLFEKFDYDINKELKVSYIGEYKHVFSHRIWLGKVFVVKDLHLKEKVSKVELPELIWSKPKEIPLPTAFKRAIDLYIKERQKALRKGFL